MGTKPLLVSFPAFTALDLTNVRNVGLFRYWTLSNLPLFLLAIPMLSLLVYSSVTTLCIGHAPPVHGHPVPHTGDTPDSKHKPPVTCDLPELALPQLVLALAAATSFHVQIINRVASGYPLWYLTVAAWLVDERAGHQVNAQTGLGQWAVRAMILYSMIQGMLFANFLPPA
jgi:phosphatidylinositol glycan class V